MSDDDIQGDAQMKLTRIVVSCLLFISACLVLPVTCFCVTNPCPPFYLKTDQGNIINPVTGENADQPFSTRQTCGACHDVDQISKGYHFMMDWDKAVDNRFKNTDTPWMVSTGLTGKLITYGFYQLAKKKNTYPDEIDLTAFDFVARTPPASKGFQKPGCAACHAGGGLMEFDRDGFRYDRHLAENPELARTLDGDYYQSRWDKTGVIEPDCFICHAGRYHMQTRILQIKDLNFKWAGVAASGIGRVYGRVSRGEIPRVVYNKRLFNEDGTFYMPDMVFKPEAKNCLLCHATIELGKRGTSWDDPLNPDVHQLAGLTCVDCHPGDIRHNFAKGNAMAGSVADDLDNTMRSCKDCHMDGYKGATRMKHKQIRKDHLDKLSCEACHIPELGRSAAGAMFLNTGVFGKYGQINTRRFGEHRPWKPAYVIRAKDKDKIPRITPVNPMINTLFTNRDKSGIYTPLFLSEVEEAYEHSRDQMTQKDVSYDFHRHEDIILMLNTLTRSLDKNKRFTAIAPHLHTGGLMYSLTPALTLAIEKDTTWVSRIPWFSISHNVSAVEKSLGAGGCTDCHAKDSHLFNGRVVTDFFGDNGKPLTISMSQFLGLSPFIQKWNHGFGLYLKAALPFFAFLVVILLLTGVFKGLISRHIPGSTEDWPGYAALLVIFCLGHFLMIDDLGGLASLYETFMTASAMMGPGLMAIATGLLFYLMPKQIKNRLLLRGGQAVTGMTAVTGLLLWYRPEGGIMFALLGVHGILAFFTIVLLLICFVLVKKK
ncbi:MAG: hypothetical protein KKE44_10265 [Proteobacteria bacterium]|nr:hypothetical protein [Pseudomonadota bacterium]MBU1583107.1 hypothetical protein [Pseudomonadota bacterium]MBU2455694.1 hypothetical protein [Pseudomonadota bacterium]MBU2629372.1 hypothetical protein [Pseudomonadota bacterium]